MELCKAIILKIINYSDTQKIIQVYSLQKGYLSLISPSTVIKRKYNPVHFMQVAEIEYFENEKANFHKLHTVSTLIPLPNLYFDVVKMNIILLWGEILNLILKNEGKNEDLFEFIVRSVEYLNSTPNNIGNFNLFFLYRLAGFIGFKINTASWQEGYVFNISDGGFHPADQNLPSVSGPNTARVIHQLCTFEAAQLHEIVLNRDARNILLDIILLFYSTHLNINFNVKSIQVIREVFQ